MERFWAKVDKDGPIPEHRPELGPCWVWTKATKHDGYGMFGAGRKVCGSVLAHRYAYHIAKGPIPAGLTVDHQCDNPPCVNADHLTLATIGVNVLRSVKNPTALNARKTHCKRGHEFTDPNTILLDGGRRRMCRACNLMHGKNARARKAAAA